MALSKIEKHYNKHPEDLRLLRSLEAISILAESDALHLGSLLVLIDKLQENTSL